MTARKRSAARKAARPTFPAPRESVVMREVASCLGLMPEVVIVNFDLLKGVPKERRATVTVQLYQQALERLRRKKGPGVLMWRVNTGGAKLGGEPSPELDGLPGAIAGRPPKKRERFVQFGPPGQGDYQGIVLPWGVWVHVEVKRPGVSSSKQSPVQVAFEALTTGAGAIYIVTRSGPDAQEQVRAAIARIQARFDRVATETQ